MLRDAQRLPKIAACMCGGNSRKKKTKTHQKLWVQSVAHNVSHARKDGISQAIGNEVKAVSCAGAKLLISAISRCYKM